jgi:hypothetical protein
VFWTVLAVGLLAVALAVAAVARSSGRTVAARLASTARWVVPAAWPLAVLVAGVAGLWLHQQVGLNPYFRTPEGQIGRVFWHNVTTALANHPDRGEHLGIPAGMLAYDDQVGYFLFDREIAARGEDRAAYLVGDRDWGYRTTDPGLDFRWGAYDLVLRDVVLRTARSEPRFVASALLKYQPLSAAKLIASPEFLRWKEILAPPIVLALLIGSVAAATGSLGTLGRPLVAWACCGLAALGPVLVAAVVELRVVEVFFLVLLGGALAVCWPISLLAGGLGGLAAARAPKHRATPA